MPVATRANRTLDEMQENPQGDWTIADIERVCRQIGISCSPPTRGSHYKISSELLTGALTVPKRSPVKVVYIKDFVNLARTHLKHIQKGTAK